MQHKIAIVTGGGSGLGYAIAQKFIQNKYITLLIGRTRSKLEAACEQFGANAHFEVCDLADLNTLPALVGRIMQKFGRIDILINNAGIHLKKDMIEVSDEEFQKVIQTNQNSVFALSREVAKEMLGQKSGAIINISSMASQYGIPKVIAYSAAKSAIEGMTRAMAVELSPKGIRVNCVAPGFIRTDMSSSALDKDPERKRRILERTPLGELGSPEDVAHAVYFLASEEAKYITGVVLPVDGGNSIGF
ncbi:MAG: SDR family oxidoreductase [Microscillaceae bacterium]|nr:SDR family oxidoreductase [Microscillaceae bacterium]